MQAFEIDYKSKMSTAEISIFNNMSRSKQLDYLFNAKNALETAQSIFQGMLQTNSKADAFRHAYFSLLNVHTLGLALATSLGDAHEAGADPSQWLATQMDLHNNNVGRNAYHNVNPNQNYIHYYSDLAYQMVINGNLVYISGGTLLATNY